MAGNVGDKGGSLEFGMESFDPESQNFNDYNENEYVLLPNTPIKIDELNVKDDGDDSDDGGKTITNTNELLTALQSNKLTSQKGEGPLSWEYENPDDLPPTLNFGTQQLSNGEDYSGPLHVGFYLQVWNHIIKGEPATIQLVEKGEDFATSSKMAKAGEVGVDLDNVVIDAVFLQRELNMASDGTGWFKKNYKTPKFIFKIPKVGEQIVYFLITPDGYSKVKDKNFNPPHNQIIFRRFQLIPQVLHDLIGYDADSKYKNHPMMDETGAPTHAFILVKQYQAIKVGMTCWSTKAPEESLKRRLSSYNQSGRYFYAAFAAALKVLVKDPDEDRPLAIPYPWLHLHAKKRAAERFEGKIHLAMFLKGWMVAKRPGINLFKTVEDYFNVIKQGLSLQEYRDFLIDKDGLNQPKASEVVYIPGNHAAEWCQKEISKYFNDCVGETFSLEEDVGYSYAQRLGLGDDKEYARKSSQSHWSQKGKTEAKVFIEKTKDFADVCELARKAPDTWDQITKDTETVGFDYKKHDKDAVVFKVWLPNSSTKHLLLAENENGPLKAYYKKNFGVEFYSDIYADVGQHLHFPQVGVIDSHGYMKADDWKKINKFSYDTEEKIIKLAKEAEKRPNIKPGKIDAKFVHEKLMNEPVFKKRNYIFSIDAWQGISVCRKSDTTRHTIVKAIKLAADIDKKNPVLSNKITIISEGPQRTKPQAGGSAATEGYVGNPPIGSLKRVPEKGAPPPKKGKQKRSLLEGLEKLRF